MNVILLHSKTLMFRLLMWPSSGWGEQEHNLDLTTLNMAALVVETCRRLLCIKITLALNGGMTSD
jgi:hypothetical protein